jgi:hypothetical protein
MNNLDSLNCFSAGSANDDRNKHLWVKGASLFIPQLNQLLEQTNYTFTITPVEDFQHNDIHVPLGELFTKHGSDKSSRHNYHIVYAFLLEKLGVEQPLRLLEIGLGTNNPELVSTMGVYGKPGASLYAFREYLPNAAIYGGDIDKNILFESERIRTGFVDQLDIHTFDALSERFGQTTYNVIIDDGLHSIGANFNTLLFGLSHLADNGWIIIEDIHIADNWRAIDYILKTTNKYETYIVKTALSYVYLVHKPVSDIV